jgi:phenylpropionate dioxygenase-like ring-hydroxylating dioxygenase large terminal subunit
MLAKADSELLQRTGPGTAMGAFMRQYWIPAAKSEELVADGPPVRLMLLGEKLIAFRDSAGRVGVMDHRCPHRCASLWFGRNEAGGLRCVYHGWKYDVEGRCLDQPNVPPHQDFRDKVRARAYPAQERNGVVWTYMGPRKVPPPLPAIEAAMAPGAQITFIQRECNWLQAIEGEIDTSHFGFLHAGHLDPDKLPRDDPSYYTVLNRTPDYHFAETPWGTMYAAFRDADAEHVHYRCAQYLFPFWAEIPQGELHDLVVARAWVPMDDTHTMFTMFATRPFPGVPLLPNKTGWYGRYRAVANEANDYNIDRAAQARKETYTGIAPGFVHLEDQAITESMGPIIDYGFETLAPSDLMIAQTRRRMLRAVNDFSETGRAPPGVDDPEIFLGARSGQFLARRGADWQSEYRARLARARRFVELAPA